jgi:hypothetical protein
VALGAGELADTTERLARSWGKSDRRFGGCHIS